MAATLRSEDRLAILNVGRALAALGRDGQVRRLAASLPDGDRPGRAKVLLDWSRELRTHGRARADARAAAAREELQGKGHSGFVTHGPAK